MSEVAGWTQSQLVAWSYILSGAQQGLTATEALRQYRAGGGAIRDSLWYGLYKDAFSLVGVREKIEQIPMSYLVPESMATDSQFDWREKYVMQMRVHGIDPETGLGYSRYVTVENDRLVTKREWINLAQEALDSIPGTEPIIVERASEWTFYKRVDW